MKKIFLARNKVKAFGHPRPPLIRAYGPWFAGNCSSKWGTLY